MPRGRHALVVGALLLYLTAAWAAVVWLIFF